MRFKKAMARTVATGAIGLASLGVGGAVAEAAATPTTTSSHATAGDDQRTISQPGAVKRPDLGSFTFRGRQVTPVFDQYKRGWGFWFFGFWVPVVL
jgi:hypothetical protein